MVAFIMLMSLTSLLLSCLLRCKACYATPIISSASPISSFMNEYAFIRMPTPLCLINANDLTIIQQNWAFGRLADKNYTVPFPLAQLFEVTAEYQRFITELQQVEAITPYFLPFKLNNKAQGSQPLQVTILQHNDDLVLCSCILQLVALPSAVVPLTVKQEETSSRAPSIPVQQNNTTALYGLVQQEYESFEQAQKRQHRLPNTSTLSPAIPKFTPESAYYTPVFVLKKPIHNGIFSNNEEMQSTDTETEEQVKLFTATKIAVKHLLTGTASFEENFKEALKALGEAAKVHVVSVWQNKVDEEEQLHAHLVTEWSATEYSINNWARYSKFCYGKDMPSLENRLKNCVTIAGLTKNLPFKERKALTARGVYSYLASPITLNEVFWGFIAYGESKEERQWTPIEKSALSTTATLMGTVLSLLHTNQELLQARNRFKDISIATGEVICELNSQNIVTYISERCIEVFGEPAAALTDKHASYLVNSSKRFTAFYQQLCMQIEKQGFFRGIEHSFIDKKGKEHHLRSSGLPTFGVNGQLQGIRMTCVDITKEVHGKNLLKDALDGIQSANEELALYANITQDLAKQAEAANHAKSNFLANMGHEVRTPINIISGMAYLVMQSQLTEKQRYFIEKIDAASHSLLEIMNNIIEFAKVERNTLFLAEQPITIKELILSVTNSYTEKCAQKKINLSTCIDPNLPETLMGDPLRISQIFKNLINNAIKFTHVGGIHISCLLEESRSNSVVLSCRVEDTGIGIDPEKQHTLFEPFTQIDSSTTRRYSGTGVGLALTRRLVESMNGSITVQSNLTMGASFAFSLTLKRHSASIPSDLCGKSYSLPADLTHDDFSDFIDANILIVALNPKAQQHMLMEIVSHMGVTPTMVESIEEATEKVLAKPQSPPYDIVVFALHDIEDEERGRIITSLRAISSLACVPFISYSVCAFKQGTCTNKAAGINACIDPNVSVKEVQATLGGWVRLSYKIHNKALTPLLSTLRKQHKKEKQVPVTKDHTQNKPIGYISPENKTKLIKLAALLEDNNAKAADAAAKLRPILRIVAPQLLDDLMHNIAIFEFQNALEILNAIFEQDK